MSFISLPPATVLNVLALLVACPGIWLLHQTRSRERRELKYLDTRAQLARIDEPMQVQEVPALRLNRFCYRVGGSCLGFSVLLSTVSTLL